MIEIGEKEKDMQKEGLVMPMEMYMLETSKRMKEMDLEQQNLMMKQEQKDIWQMGNYEAKPKLGQELKNSDGVYTMCNGQLIYKERVIHFQVLIQFKLQEMEINMSEIGYRIKLMAKENSQQKKALYMLVSQKIIDTSVQQIDHRYLLSIMMLIFLQLVYYFLYFLIQCGNQLQLYCSSISLLLVFKFSPAALRVFQTEILIKLKKLNIDFSLKLS
ncbi:unnamed protein product (macronuclear) [Paramecium tetraurelia]|uniref:Uncharacterized protein n=1 Tax=Paramecium tetraurelia TaxID=5888 RepID=A0CEJ4_PARTE|nr:uncharacterized protein GSPATT00037649001 [Paramecium tetraurelia]CAK69211.1 unnamed protein product [Paramecium tetraurelia]|eukprot:XP_001436608.1 hypothetical protein (macronuclear) [Paramecium tetraurelia strain d4-2]